MNRRQGLIYVFSITWVLAAATLNAQPWSGIIAPSRAIDWSTAGVTGGIPNRTTICASLTSTASATTIQSALNTCPSGQVVSLAAGNYSLSHGLTIPSNVTLRGAGGGQTNLTFSGSSMYYWGTYLVGFIGGYTGGFENSPPGPSGSNNCSGAVGPPATYSGCSQLRQWIGTNGSTGVYTKGATVLNLASAPTGLQV